MLWFTSNPFARAGLLVLELLEIKSLLNTIERNRTSFSLTILFPVVILNIVRLILPDVDFYLVNALY